MSKNTEAIIICQKTPKLYIVSYYFPANFLFHIIFPQIFRCSYGSYVSSPSGPDQEYIYFLVILSRIYILYGVAAKIFILASQFLKFSI